MGLVIKTSVPTASGAVLRHDGVVNSHTLGLWDFMHRRCFNPASLSNPTDNVVFSEIKNLVGQEVGTTLNTSATLIDAVTPSSGSLEVNEVVTTGDCYVRFNDTRKGLVFGSTVADSGQGIIKWATNGFYPYFYRDGTEPNQPTIAWSFWFRFLQAPVGWNNQVYLGGVGDVNDVGNSNLLLDLQQFEGGDGTTGRIRYRGTMTSGAAGVDFEPLPQDDSTIWHLVLSAEGDWRNGELDRSGTKGAYIDPVANNHEMFFGVEDNMPAGDGIELNRMMVQDLNGESTADFVARERAYIEANKTRIPWHPEYVTP